MERSPEKGKTTIEQRGHRDSTGKRRPERPAGRGGYESTNERRARWDLQDLAVERSPETGKATREATPLRR